MEHLLEYQDYLLAHRLRELVGGRLRPGRAPLSLALYAARRLERQRLAAEIVGSGNYRERLRRVDALTEELNFGFWHNPDRTVEALKAVAEAGGCRALESEEAFVAELFTLPERQRLGDDGQRRVARYYLGLLRASSCYLDGEVFTRLRSEVEGVRASLPVFVLPATDGPAV